MATLATATPAMLMKDYIVADGRSTEFTGWTFKFGALPATPNQVIAIVDQGGPAGMPHLLLDYMGLQFLVRSEVGGSGYQDSYLMIRKVRDIVLGVCGHPTEFSELNGVLERGNIVPLGYDDKDRHIWSWNARLIVEPETNALTQRVSL
jgi:hypothetical protein